MNDEPYTIVAMMPDVIPEWMESSRLGNVEVWTPFAFANIWSESERGLRGYGAIGRLKPEVSVEEAEADLATIAAGLAATHPIASAIPASRATRIDPAQLLRQE